MEGLRQYTSMLHAHGAVATVELNHCGANRFPSAGREAVGPCGIEDHGGVLVHEMDENLMNYVEGCFAQAAWYLKQAGYDGVIPHMASGWLLQQFLSPHTNHRRDEYGGSAENRIRFPLRVLRAIRERCGSDFLIIPRLSCSEYIEGGYGIEDAVTFCRLMDGLIDMVNVTAGVYYDPVRSREFSSMYEPHNLHRELAAAIKAECSFPVMLTGGINSPEEAEQLISDGICDLIGLGRQMLADPHWAKKAACGQADDIARCIRCFRCFPGPLKDTKGSKLVPPDKKCTVNPCSDLNELDPPLKTWPEPSASRRVLVVGGGISGLTAAYTAAQQGHQVTLAEKSDTLGGLLTFSDYDCYKTDLHGFKELSIRRVKESGVCVKLNTEITPENIGEYAVDDVIIAVGSVPLQPRISGIEHAVSAMDAYRAPEKLGNTVVIAGGGQVGCELALTLAHFGKKVTIVEMRDDVAVDANPMHRIALMDMLRQSSVDILCGLECCRFSQDGIEARTKAGKTVYLPADSAVVALGMTANSNSANELKTAIGQTARVQLIGNCVKADKIQVAVEDGYLAARRII